MAVFRNCQSLEIAVFRNDGYVGVAICAQTRTRDCQTSSSPSQLLGPALHHMVFTAQVGTGGDTMWIQLYNLDEWYMLQDLVEHWNWWKPCDHQCQLWYVMRWRSVFVETSPKLTLQLR